MDEGHRFVMIETRNDVDDGTEKHLVRYQHHNHIGSAALELDDSAQVISYEEYYPFGTTSYQAKSVAIKAAAKRYRFTGMERDEETGLEYHSARYYIPWLARWLSADPKGLVDGVNLYRSFRNNPLTYSDPKGTEPKNGDRTTDPPDPGVDVGPLRFRNFSGTIENVHGDFNLRLNNIWSSDRSLDIESAFVGGTLHLRSDVDVPSFNLHGSGSYRFNLEGLRIQHGLAEVDLSGQASLSAGPVGLTLDASGYGSMPVPSHIPLSREAVPILTQSLGQFTGWVGVHGRVDLLNRPIGAFSVSGDVGPGAQGRLQVRGTVGIPSFDDGPATVVGHISGTGSFEGSRFRLAGQYQADLLPLPVWTTGTWSLDNNNGFQISGHYLGPQFGPLGLNVGINPTGNVTDDTLQLRLTDAMQMDRRGGGAVNMFEPGPSYGYSYYNYSRSGTTFFNVGVSPTSSLVPYYPGGVSQPFGGPSAGTYFGLRYSTTFRGL
jgi:RHS repeat-associated protein